MRFMKFYTLISMNANKYGLGGKVSCLQTTEGAACERLRELPANYGGSSSQNLQYKSSRPVQCFFVDSCARKRNLSNVVSWIPIRGH